VTAEAGVQFGKSNIHKDAVMNTAGDEEDQGGPAGEVRFDGDGLKPSW